MSANEKNSRKTGNPLTSKPAIFLYGVATTYLASASGSAIRKVAEPVLTGTIKTGIRVGRAARGTYENVSATVSDSYAKAQHELIQEEKAAKPTVVKMENRAPKDKDKHDHD
jgi:hypothetical protein